MITINNMPAYANNYEFIVASLVDGELWFYGAYHKEDKAIIVANRIDGVLIRH